MTVTVVQTNNTIHLAFALKQHPLNNSLYLCVVIVVSTSQFCSVKCLKMYLQLKLGHILVRNCVTYINTALQTPCALYKYACSHMMNSINYATFR